MKELNKEDELIKQELTKESMESDEEKENSKASWV